ncbi:unnamed protein product [Rotaria sp. Silwood2]|nr:unnamed protein product [Rotaria sp. Silwood2]CAF3138138.1 unnamed protein product [Rotaria sp. Silwood2]CAF4399045.1 unnamed protein product [Rotaria sp. Silwood2]CAF4447938.1 unnamed protein product [Rotaria sp. Silwood2]
MYKVLTSLWSKPSTSKNNKARLSSVNSSDISIDEDDWVLVSDNVSKVTSPNDYNSIMTNSWVASPPLMRTDESSFANRSSSPTTHHFNPIENLLIEHASMSVYEQIASRTRSKRHRKTVNNNLLDEQVEEDKDDGDDDDDRSSVVLQYPSQHPNLSSIHHRNLNASLCHSTNSSTSTLESSTSSLMAHHRHLHRMHQRRRRSVKTSSKLILTNSIDETKHTSNKILERQRLNHARTPKLFLHQPSRSNH